MCVSPTTPLTQSPPLSDYTNTAFEVLIAAFSLLPFFVLAYFYSALPERVPLFMNLSGEVETWGAKSVLSVFRVPLMAVDTQLVCLLAKYGTVKSAAVGQPDAAEGQADRQKQYLRLNAGLWDWLRAVAAFKMSASSLNTVFLSVEGFGFLSRPTFVVTAVVASLSVVGGLVYGYRMLVLKRGAGEGGVGVKAERPVDARRVYGGLLYFNPADPALFAGGYVFNFGNKWAWVFIACLVSYPLLVFLPG